MANKDPYSVLGVTKSSTDDEIKSAYRRLTKQYHPDLHPDDPSCAEKMSEVNAAYDLIKDAASRQKYEDSQNIHPGSGYGYGSGYGSYGGYSQNGYSGYGSYGNYGQSGYYSSSGYSSSQSYGPSGYSDGDDDGVWVFTPFGAFKMGGRTSQTASQESQSSGNTYYTRRTTRRRFGLLRYILIFLLINALFRSCTRMLFWGNYYTQADPNTGAQTERQYEMPDNTSNF